MLEYESALTRKLAVPSFARTHVGEEGYYCTSAHFVVRFDFLSTLSHPLTGPLTLRSGLATAHDKSTGLTSNSFEDFVTPSVSKLDLRLKQKSWSDSLTSSILRRRPDE